MNTCKDMEEVLARLEHLIAQFGEYRADQDQAHREDPSCPDGDVFAWAQMAYRDAHTMISSVLQYQQLPDKAISGHKKRARKY